MHLDKISLENRIGGRIQSGRITGSNGKIDLTNYLSYWVFFGGNFQKNVKYKTKLFATITQNKLHS